MTIAKDLMARLYGHNIWDGFKPLTPDPQGWNGDHPSLKRLAEAPGAKIVIDVGVWKGQSTITMATAMRDKGIDGCVLAVDTFLGSLEHWDRKGLYERHHGQPDLYNRFLTNCVVAEVTDYVIPIPQTSASALAVIAGKSIRASVIHIDAAHEYADVLRDAEDYWKVLDVGGYMIGDDYHHTWPGVIRAAGTFSAQVCMPLEIASPKWIIKKLR